MLSKKRTTKEGPDDSSAWRIILEKIEEQNRLTIEAVNSRADSLERRVDEGLAASEERDRILAAGIRDLCTDLKADIARVDAKVGRVEASLKEDIARVEAKVDKLVPLEERVAALEKRSA